ncbi:hypothetical protein ACJW30_11G136200 [Castanea mollissima]
MFMASYDNYSSGHALKNLHQIGRWKLASHDTRFFLTVLRLDWYFVGFVQLNDSLFVEFEIGQSVVVDDPDWPFTVKAFDANHCLAKYRFEVPTGSRRISSMFICNNISMVSG